jgi:microcystin-dependent protein
MSQGFIAEIRMYAFPGNIKGWVPCDGRTLPASEYHALFDLIGTTFGGDNNNFKVPDLRNRVLIGNGPGYPSFAHGGEEAHGLVMQEMPKHNHKALASSNASNVMSPSDNYWPSDPVYVRQPNATMSDQALSQVGFGVPHNNMSPYLAVNYMICVAGIFPGKDFTFDDYLGCIKIFAGNVESEKSPPCDGRLMVGSKNTAMLSLLKKTFGGDGVTTFALPDLRGRAAVCCDLYGEISPPKPDEGPVVKLTPYKLAEVAGEATVKLSVAQMATHYHPVYATKFKGNMKNPSGQMWANADNRPPIACFANAKGVGTVMSPAAIGEVGGDQPHNNMMPYQAIRYLMSQSGVYPPRW